MAPPDHDRTVGVSADPERAPEDASRRASQLVTSLGAVRARIADACAQAGRDPRAVTLIAVTKTRPAGDVAALASLGVRDIGENKDQEARAKIAQLTGSAFATDLRWHLVGRLQSNKARSVAAYAHAVHSLDRAKLARVLGGAAADEPRSAPLEIFVQISLDGDPDRGGCAPDDLPALADAVAEHESLRLRGVMAVPPMGSDPDVGFARLAELAATVRERHPRADAISAGMSDDLEAALRHGATHLRVGTALLGRRDRVFR